MTQLNEEIKILSAKYNRFPLKYIKNLDKEHIDELNEYKKNGLIGIKKIIFCTLCGTDLEEYSGQESVFCPYDEQEIIIDNSNISTLIFVTEDGSKFFLDKRDRNQSQA